MYLIDYVSNWDEKEGQEASARHMSWIRELYDYMTPYVSKSPRTAFLNYKDLDLGRVRINGGATFVDPRIWGRMYFKNNFLRLVKTKSNVDPENFFGGEQTIPPTIENGTGERIQELEYREATSSPSKALAQQHNFLQCVASHSNQSMPQLYVPKSPSFLSVLQSSIYNLRFTSPATPKPLFIITPNHESQIRAVVVCSKKHGLKITVRSGGHDFEGLSYRANVPFVLIDLVNFRTIDVNIKDNSAWVQAGATLGEVYYRISEKSPVHGFPAGACPTVGVGGHISGGGFRLMVRKYCMAADHVLDARIINAKGEILDRKTMGEDLFWAIRGGGVTSFGVLLAWKIELVPVPLLHILYLPWQKP
ncbi:hypothetical protein Syun_026453 [Stephania yunnanensis]|uniref:FAD-binding PCMH-type domain-containing protein n=1 Tax=Stephania yunnanensis TaxID=152371 RepID=A0AAP0EZ40_9MAGN